MRLAFIDVDSSMAQRFIAMAARAPRTTLNVETVVLVAAPVSAAAEVVDAAAAVAEAPITEISAEPLGAKTCGR